MPSQRTQVAIIGSGPSGLTLAQLLDGAGVESVVLERRSRDYVQGRVRAGVIEQGTVEILRRAGVAARLEREGLKHHGVEIAAGERRYRIDFAAQSASLTVYGQTELTKDLMEARDASGVPPIFEVEDVALENIEGDRPRVRYLRARRAAHARLRLHRGLRRLPRRQPPGDSSERADDARARLSVRLARRARGRAAGVAGARLCEPRARVRTVQHALGRAQPLLRAMRSRHRSRRVERRAFLGRARCAFAGRARRAASCARR